MSSTFPSIQLTLPPWIDDVIVPGKLYATHEARMAFAIMLSELNVKNDTGGPFGAAIFERDTGKLVAPGVNRVIPCHSSMAHAEVVAISTAQRVLETFDLAAARLEPMELVTSSQPCIQCFGAVWWSGLQSVVVGATGEDVESITGFAEGPLPPFWEKILANRAPLPPVIVHHGILRERACDALKAYAKSGALVYNAGSDAK